MPTAQQLYETVRPIPHFDGEWSIDFDPRTKTARIQTTRMESKQLKKGGSDIYRGSRAGLLEYLHKAYPDAKPTFVGAWRDEVVAKYVVVVATSRDVTKIRKELYKLLKETYEISAENQSALPRNSH